jgi:hypothetical protein
VGVLQQKNFLNLDLVGRYVQLDTYTAWHGMKQPYHPNNYTWSPYTMNFMNRLVRGYSDGIWKAYPEPPFITAFTQYLTHRKT